MLFPQDSIELVNNLSGFAFVWVLLVVVLTVCFPLIIILGNVFPT